MKISLKRLKKHQGRNGTAFSLQEFINMIIKLLLISSLPLENPSGASSRKKWLLCIDI